MIKIYYPFELKKISSISEYLFIIKNCFRLIKNHGLYKKIEGMYFYVSWSKNKSNWEINFSKKTSDKKSKEVSNLALDIFSNKNICNIFEKYHMKKNTNRS